MMNADAFKGWMKEIVDVELNKLPTDKIGRIDPNYSSGLPRIIFDGEVVVSGKVYPCLSSYKPVKNDRVLLRAVKGSYVVLGAIDTKASPVLWDGTYYMTAGHVVTPTKKLSECPNGWTLIWSFYDAGAKNQDFNFVNIPKEFAQLHPGAGFWNKLKATSSDDAQKYLYVRDNTLTGHANNSSGTAGKQVLRYVLAY